MSPPARCVDRAGFAVLLDYLQDIRAPLAAHARAELASITGLHAGPAGAVWQRWLTEQPDPLPPRPFRPPTAAQQAWDETICRTADDIASSPLTYHSPERRLP